MDKGSVGWTPDYDSQIELKRMEKDYMQRLARIMREDKDILDRLAAGPDDTKETA